VKNPVASVAALAVAAFLTVPGPGAASAGVYRAAICNPGMGARHADASFLRTSTHYVSEASCGGGEAGLAVRHEGKRTRDGRWGGWTVRAPRGTVISHLGVSAAGRRSGGQVPQLLAAPLNGPIQPFAVPDPGVERSRWTGPARSFLARLACQRRGGCGRGRTASIRVKRLTIRLADRVPPTIALRGSAFSSDSRRGIQTIQPLATDVGAGVHRFLLQVNGDPVTAHAASCQAADGYALRLRPCPPSARTTFKAVTTMAPFRQGPNEVRVCSIDYGLDTQANRACADRHVRIDNLCPISATGPGPRLEAWLSHPKDRTHGRGEATVRGRLRSATDAPVAGARVCIATRVPIAGAGEHIVATPVTGPDGRFSTELPSGPNRQVRVAYWWSGNHVAERHLNLRVRARPRLKLRPRRSLHNGRRVRFKVRLQEPAAPRRWVRIQARSGKRWVELSNGRTNLHGSYRAHYRFHSTSGRHKYAFRAVVPRQRGYPYRGGHSKVRRVTVTG
jgi:hypothetical protein